MRYSIRGASGVRGGAASLDSLIRKAVIIPITDDSGDDRLKTVFKHSLIVKVAPMIEVRDERVNAAAPFPTIRMIGLPRGAGIEFFGSLAGVYLRWVGSNRMPSPLHKTRQGLSLSRCAVR